MPSLESKCAMCAQTKKTRAIDLYPFGSEGLLVCHECEMEINVFVRGRVFLRMQEDMSHRRLLKTAMHNT